MISSATTITKTSANVTSTSFLEDEEGFYSALYNRTLNDPRLDIETLYTSWTGTGITVTTGLLSLLSSCLIIIVIVRSPTGLNSIYHRLMLGLSCASILQSCAMTITTLPMPKDMIYPQFEGLVLGNSASCSFQAFCFNTGFHATTFYTIFLIFYYLFALHFCMPDATFSKYIEPLFHAFASIFSIVVSIFSWNFDLMHPSPLYPFCVTTAYPYWCKTKEDCLNGELSQGRVATLWSVSTLTLAFLSVSSLIALAVIVCSIYSRERNFRKWVHDNQQTNDNRQSSFDAAFNSFAQTKNVIRQSAYYIMAFMSVYIFPLVNLFADASAEELPKILDSKLFQMAYVILRPSQGTFYLIIFLYHKIWKLRRTYPTLSFMESVKEVVFRRAESEDKIVSRLDLVVRDNARNNLRLAKDEQQDSVEESMNDDNIMSIDVLNNKDKEDDDFKIDSPERMGRAPQQVVADEGSYQKSIFGAEIGSSPSNNVISPFGSYSFDASRFNKSDMSKSEGRPVGKGISFGSGFSFFSNSTDTNRKKNDSAVLSSKSSVYVSKGNESFEEDGMSGMSLG